MSGFPRDLAVVDHWAIRSSARMHAVPGPVGGRRRARAHGQRFAGRAARCPLGARRARDLADEQTWELSLGRSRARRRACRAALRSCRLARQTRLARRAGGADGRPDGEHRQRPGRGQRDRSTGPATTTEHVIVLSSAAKAARCSCCSRRSARSKSTASSGRKPKRRCAASSPATASRSTASSARRRARRCAAGSRRRSRTISAPSDARRKPRPAPHS